MASPKSILALSLGSQTVRLAQLQADGKGGLVLVKYQTSELLADPAADATRINQTQLALQELVGAAKAKGQRVNYAIPAQSIFTRVVKLPAVDEDKIDQIVAFEAQQNVPFQIEEVVWDYQLVSQPNNDGLEVVLGAIKADLLEDLNTAVESSGLVTGVVDVAPMALYNAFRYNYADVDGCSLLVDIGARTSNLVFIEGQRVYSRSIAVGGNTITAAIAKDFSENFTQAEARKKKDAFVSLGGAYAEPENPDQARISKMVRNIMTRLHADISRSISYYRSQQGGTQPVRVYLCGGAVAMPYMREFFSEKLAMPIEFFNPLRNIAVGGGIEPGAIGREAHCLGELIGLGLRSVSECPIELNLRPTSVIRKQAMSARKPFLVLAAASLVALLGTWSYYYKTGADLLSKATETLNPKIASLQTLNTSFAAAEAERKVRQEAARPLLQAVEDRDFYLRLIDDLNARLPSRHIWVTSMSVTDIKAADSKTPANRSTARATPTPPPAPAGAAAPTQQLVLRGLYLYNPRGGEIIDDYAKELAKSPFLDFDFSKLTGVVVTRTAQTETDWTFVYELHLPLKKQTP